MFEVSEGEIQRRQQQAAAQRAHAATVAARNAEWAAEQERRLARFDVLAGAHVAELHEEDRGRRALADQLAQRIAPALHERAQETAQALQQARDDVGRIEQRLGAHAASAASVSDVPMWASRQSSLAAQREAYLAKLEHAESQHAAARQAVQTALRRELSAWLAELAQARDGAAVEETERVRAAEEAARQARQARSERLQALDEQLAALRGLAF